MVWKYLASLTKGLIGIFPSAQYVSVVAHELITVKRINLGRHNMVPVRPGRRAQRLLAGVRIPRLCQGQPGDQDRIWRGPPPHIRHPVRTHVCAGRGGAAGQDIGIPGILPKANYVPISHLNLGLTTTFIISGSEGNRVRHILE